MTYVGRERSRRHMASINRSGVRAATMTRKFPDDQGPDGPGERDEGDEPSRARGSAVDRFAAVNRRLRSKFTDRPEMVDAARPRPAPPPVAPPPPPRPTPRVDVHNPPVAPRMDEPEPAPPVTPRPLNVRPPQPPAPEAPRWNPPPVSTAQDQVRTSSPGDVFRDMAPVANPLSPRPFEKTKPAPAPAPKRAAPEPEARAPEPRKPEPVVKRASESKRSQDKRGPSDAFRLFSPKEKPPKRERIEPSHRADKPEPPKAPVKAKDTEAPRPITPAPAPTPSKPPLEEPVAASLSDFGEPRLRAPTATSAFSDNTNTLDRLITRISIAAILLVGLFLAISIIPRL